MKNRMGTFYTSCRVGNHFDRNKTIEVPKVLVDTGAEFSWINANTLKKAGVNRENKSYRFVTATGQEITRPIGNSRRAHAGRHESARGSARQETCGGRADSRRVRPGDRQRALSVRCAEVSCWIDG